MLFPLFQNRCNVFCVCLNIFFVYNVQHLPTSKYARRRWLFPSFLLDAKILGVGQSTKTRAPKYYKWERQYKPKWEVANFIKKKHTYPYTLPEIFVCRSVCDELWSQLSQDNFSTMFVHMTAHKQTSIRAGSECQNESTENFRWYRWGLLKVG